MKSFIREFKDFAIKGNLIDMAVGIIIGTAFNNLVNTLVKKVVMPPLSLLTDDVNLTNKKFILREASEKTEEVAIGYGEMIEASIDFTIIALQFLWLLNLLIVLKTKQKTLKIKKL
jgi:large conductance mechanosensitive channel